MGEPERTASEGKFNENLIAKRKGERGHSISSFALVRRLFYRTMLYCPKQEQWEGSRVSVVVQTDKLELGEPSVDTGSGPSLGF